jgi:hypothetical protein
LLSRTTTVPLAGSVRESVEVALVLDIGASVIRFIHAERSALVYFHLIPRVVLNR